MLASNQLASDMAAAVEATSLTELFVGQPPFSRVSAAADSRNGSSLVIRTTYVMEEKRVGRRKVLFPAGEFQLINVGGTTWEVRLVGWENTPTEHSDYEALWEFRLPSNIVSGIRARLASERHAVETFFDCFNPDSLP